MTSISELKVELRDEKAKLRFMQPVAWGSGGIGMTTYNDQLALVTRLTHELNVALKEGGRG